MIEYDMQKLLWIEYTKKSKFMLVNIFFLYNLLKKGVQSGVEMDFMRIDENDYVNEYEIKTSKSDFKEEFLTKTDKHKLLSEKHVCCPNRFWFAAPYGIIDKLSVPDYAGLVEFKKEADGTFSHRIVKKAPLLHSNIVDPRDLFYKVYYKAHKAQDIEFNNYRKRIRKQDGSKAVEKKRISKRRSKLQFTVRKKVPTEEC